MSVSLWLFLLLPCLASSASAPNWWPAEITDLAQTVIVRSIPDFIAALRNQSIATIHVDTDLLLVGDAWPPKVIHVRRNLTIRSLDIGRLQLITFANVTDKVSLDPEVHISFRNIAATGSANAYWSLISTSPSAFFWLRDSVFMPMSCSHKSKAIPAVLTHPRPPDYPGINRLSVRVFPFCFRRRCFEQTFDVGEFFIDRPPYVAGGMLPMYTKFVADTFYACHTYFTDACTELRGYAACRAEMTTRHIEEGLSFTYPQWVLEVIVALAVLSCCALLGGGWWLLCCSSVRGGSKKPTSLGHPTASGVRLAGAADNKLDRVKLQAFLASGSFGHVYQGIWQGRTVAVKVVQHGGKTTLKISREVSISMGLAAHPNIVQTFHHFMMATTEFESQRPAAQSSDSFDSWKPYASAESSGSLGDDVQQTCIVMELCDQGNLSSHLKRHGSRVGHGRSLDEDLVLDCARGVAQGMAHLHAHNICHERWAVVMPRHFSPPAPPAATVPVRRRRCCSRCCCWRLNAVELARRDEWRSSRLELPVPLAMLNAQHAAPRPAQHQLCGGEVAACLYPLVCGGVDDTDYQPLSVRRVGGVDSGGGAAVPTAPSQPF